MSSIYEPREDSDLLVAVVRTDARGRVLDVGTGSGIQALTALENPNVSAVVAVDINVAAVNRLVENIAQLPLAQRSRIHVLRSDMFRELAGERFDTIVCNPPYLPDEEEDKDPALYGGRHGHEWSIRFLRDAREHLAPGGQMLFLFSSLTNRDLIDLELKTLRYFHETRSELAQFFERLYVYRIWRD